MSDLTMTYNGSPNKPEVIIFTDGSCPKPHGPGGWAFVARVGDKQTQKAGRANPTTNQRMELQAAIEALKFLPRPCKVSITTDSEYLQKGATTWRIKWKQNKWRKRNYDTNVMEDVANKDLWIDLDILLSIHEVTFHWVRGHDGHPENELCDKLCGKQARMLLER